MAGSSASQLVSVGNRTIKLTNLDKVMYPATGTTKADVLRYYAEIGAVMIPHVANRPATRKRWVHGVGTEKQPGEVFFEKALQERSTPHWVSRRAIAHSTGEKEYPLVNDLPTLTWLAQMAALELHVPQWQFSRTGGRRNPDRLVLDLDPGEDAALRECAEVARLTRAILLDMGLEPYPVTSGSKGIHLYAALDGRFTSDQISEVAHELARSLEADHKDLIVSDMKKSLRHGKVLIDWSQNNGSKTTIAPYSLRGRLHPTVATPRTWQELDDPDLDHLDYEQVLARVAEHGDPLRPLLAARDAGLEPTPEHMAAFESTPDARDRLEKYRSMRDRAKTPEPVPHGAPAPSTGASFVIQEHHARRLHYDFRLEYEGVLVSWAIPKGPPTSGDKNHLAVQTEDHPLEYGTFEGTIPQGEYGGGEVKIWDAGEYELEKWREGKEVIATLTGKPDGGLGGVPRKYALIHTGRAGSENNWLIHLMDGAKKRSPAVEQSADDPAASAEGRDAPVDATARGLSREARRTAAAAEQTNEERAGRRGPGPQRHRSTRATRNAEELSPMLATAGTASDLADDEDWAFEMKWDGYRALAVVDDGRVRLVSRKGNDLTPSFPELAEAIGEAIEVSSAVVDGEIVALNSRGRPDFGLLQTRAGLTKSRDVGAAAVQTPVHFIAFDLLEVQGERITGDDYDVRRAALERVVNDGGFVRVPPRYEGDFDEALDASRRVGLEGVIAKERDSTYAVGRRSRAWIKIKHDHTQEVVVAGWRPVKGGRDVGALLFAIPDSDGVLRYAGNVGTGFSERDRREMRERFEPMARKTPAVEDVPPPYNRTTTWIEPELVGEVKYSERTTSGSLRHPVWRGWRPDKSPSDVRPER
ncbi:ATP-dependent DNA ligase [Okibacterium endophyticum]